jgi:hypothetical protein
MNCPDCEKTIPEESRFCLYCGSRLPAADSAPTGEADADWENRVLCSDGNCTGTIVEGKCRICGLPG